MRQTATEKIDPLIRIQEEIKEVVRREEEHRQLTSGTSMIALDDFNDAEQDGNNNKMIGGSNDNSLTINPDDNDIIPSVVVSAVVSSLTVHEDTPSLASSVNSKESLDEHHHSDDSGISASSSPVNGTSANNNNNNNSNISNSDDFKTTPSSASGREHRYIGPNCYNLTPEPPQQKLMTRAVSTPHLASSKPRQFTFNPSQKGVMQRFIASRGKLQLNANANAAGGVGVSASNKILLNSNHAVALLNGGMSPTSAAATPPNTPMTAGIMGPTDFGSFAVHNPSSMMIMPTASVIERDADGRPIRPGYVPVELKIQRELKDIKTRESELKKIRKIRQSTPDLLDSIDNENIETDDDEDDSEVEHCYGPGKLRTAKSISELCDTPQAFNTTSPRITPSPDFDNILHAAANRSGGLNPGSSGMRPAVSLAQLCDLDPQEAPSSHRLIAQWESLIQQHA